MSAPPYMKLYVADYLADTTHLTTVEHGAYLLLLMAMWRTGGTLPARDDNLARIARLSAKDWSSIKPTILALFQISRGKLTHKRVAREMAKYDDVSGKRSEAGKRGVAEKRKGNRPQALAIADFPESNCLHNQNQNQNHISSDTNVSGDLPIAAPIPLDPDKRAWADAVALLTERGRMTETKARTFFGGLLKAHGVAAKDMLGAVGACIAAGSQDPAAYLTAAARAKGRPTGHVRDAGFV